MGRHSRSRSRSASRKRRHRSRDEHHRKRERSPPPLARPPCTSTFRCYVCFLPGHWTVDCPLLAANPSKYSDLDIKHGCWTCGRRGHAAQHCPNKLKPCVGCGALHDTDRCPYDDQTITWHEFFDTEAKRVYYQNAETKDVTWELPLKQDIVWWCCDACDVLLPSITNECVKCHSVRPVTFKDDGVPQEKEQK